MENFSTVTDLWNVLILTHNTTLFFKQVTDIGFFLDDLFNKPMQHHMANSFLNLSVCEVINLDQPRIFWSAILAW